MEKAVFSRRAVDGQAAKRGGEDLESGIYCKIDREGCSWAVMREFNVKSVKFWQAVRGMWNGARQEEVTELPRRDAETK